MNIAIFSLAHPSYGGGFEQQAKTLAHSISKNNTTVTFITLSMKATQVLAIFLSIMYFHPRFNFPELKKKDTFFLDHKEISLVHFKSIRNLRELFLKFDIIYAKNEIFDNVLLYLAKDKSTPPLICGVHTALQYAQAHEVHSKLHNLLYSSFFYSITLQVFSAFHCITKYQMKFLKKMVKGKKLYYIPNFIEVYNHEPISNKNSFQLIFVGRLTKQKGVDLFIKTIILLSSCKEFTKMKFIICGSGEYEQDIKELSKKFENVEYKGFLSQKDMKEIYKKSDILFLLSRGESFPVTILEAFNYGTLVLGSKIPGIQDIVINNINGFLISAGNVSRASKKIVELYNMKIDKYNAYNNMRLNARELVKKYYSKEVLMLQYERMFQHGKKQN